MVRSCCGVLLIASRPAWFVIILHFLVAVGTTAYWMATVISNPVNLVYITVWMWIVQSVFYLFTALGLAIRNKPMFVWTVRIGLYMLQGCAVGILSCTFLMYSRVPALLWNGSTGETPSSFFLSLGWARLRDWIGHELPLYLILLFQLVYLKRVARRSSNFAERWQEKRFVIGILFILQVLSHCAVVVVYLMCFDPSEIYLGSVSTGEFVGMTMGAGLLVNCIAKYGHWRYYSLRRVRASKAGRGSLLATDLEDEMDVFADDVDIE